MQNVNEKDKMTSTKYRGLIDGLIKIYSREGLSALWNGTSASLILISNPAIKVKAGKTRTDYGQIQVAGSSIVHSLRAAEEAHESVEK